jgi:hypothetical protein
MASKKTNIEIFLTVKDAGLRGALAKSRALVTGFASSVRNAVSPLQSLAGAALNLKTALAGALGAAGAGVFGATVLQAATAADRALFNLKTSVAAANREFQVGDTKAWAANVSALSKELQIYSTSAVTAAAAKTIDMTKRLGLSEQQMLKVIRAAANLSAGKFELSDGVERVTAALRGEAEASEALGLTLNETYVKGWYEARGATQGAWKDLNDIQKAQIRYNVLLQQSNPLLGKAAASVKTFGGVLDRLKGAAENAQAGLGSIVTNNTFFVEALNKVGTLLGEVGADIRTNRQAWMEWSKQSALAVLQFAIDFGNGINDVYKGLSGMAGTLKLAYAGTLTLGQGFQFLFEQANRLAGDSEKAEYWAQAQVDATRLIEDALAGANKSFDNAERGVDFIETATRRLTQLKTELQNIKVAEVNPVDGAAKKAEVEFKNINGVWTDVAKDIDTKGRDAADAVATSFSKSAQQMEDDYERAISATVRRLEAMQATAAGHRDGGLIQRFARGGRLPGYGGGDRIPALLEAGEYVVRKEAVSRFGAGLFAALNSLRLPDLPRYASGGPVGAGASGGMMTINLNFGPGRAATVQASPTDARTLARELARIERLRSA